MARDCHKPRRIWPIALAAVLPALLLSTGCGNGDKGDTQKPDGRIPKVMDVGSEIPYAPFEFGRPPYQGFDVDMVDLIARRLHAKPRFVNTPFNTIFRDLGQKKFDMVAAGAVITSIPGGRTSFSDPYLPADLALVVRHGSQVKTKDDLADKTVGAQRGSAGADYARSDTKARSVRTYALIDDALNALAAGQIDAVIHDYPVARWAQRSRRNLVVVDAIGTGKNYGFAFPKDSPLEARVNAALDGIKRDGSYARVYRKWFRASPPEGFAGLSP